MAGRPKKQTVDYFPHYVKHGKTMEILERRFGFEGYAAWFKLLEQLGGADGHYIDCSDEFTWEFLTSKIHKKEDLARQILDLLAKLGAIDRDLWVENKVIWSQNFVDGIADAYRNRRSDIPAKPNFLRQKSNFLCQKGNFLQPSADVQHISEVENTQTKLEYTRLENTREKKMHNFFENSSIESAEETSNEKTPPPTPPRGGYKSKSKKSKSRSGKLTPLPENFTISPEVRAWAEKGNYTDLEAHLEAFILRVQAKGYTYIDWDSAFKTAIRENWAKIGTQTKQKQASSPYGYDGEPEWMKRRFKGS